MQLENPKLSAIISSLPNDVRVEAARRLAALNRTMASQVKADNDLIDNLRRILQSPNPQAQKLRELIKEVVNA